MRAKQIAKIGQEQGVLSDIQILRRVVAAKGDEDDHLLFLSPLIDPKEQLGPSSLDLRLGTRLRILQKFTGTHIDLTNKEEFRNQREQYFTEQSISADGYFVMHPGEFALGSTLEYMRLPLDLAGRLEGRSSYGRIGLQIHATAGFVDPGFEGTLTFELINSGDLPVRISPGLRLGQICFFRLDNTQVSYMLKRGSKYGRKIDAELSRADCDPEMPSKRAIAMNIRGDFGPEQIRQFARFLPRDFRSRVGYEGQEISGLKDESAIPDPFTYVAGAASIAALYLTISEKIKRGKEAKLWDKTRLEKVIANHLLAQGITTFHIESLSDFADLNNKQGSCTVVVHDPHENKKFRITLFSDGDCFVLDIGSAS